MNRTISAVIQSKKETWIIALSGCLFMLAVLYVYFLSASIVHVVIRQEVSQAIKVEQSDIASLESSYMEAQHRLSSNVANLSGYTKAERKIYINRGSTGLVLHSTNE